jgi:hypothetical protein
MLLQVLQLVEETIFSNDTLFPKEVVAFGWQEYLTQSRVAALPLDLIF